MYNGPSELERNEGPLYNLYNAHHAVEPNLKWYEGVLFANLYKFGSARGIVPPKVVRSCDQVVRKAGIFLAQPRRLLALTFKWPYRRATRSVARLTVEVRADDHSLGSAGRFLDSAGAIQ
jgi:hypothetical protein